MSSPSDHAAQARRDRLKLEIKRASGPFLLYILLVVVGLFAAGDIIRNLAGDKPWVNYATYRVGFETTKGVQPGRVELRLAGVKAGSITENDLVKGRPVLTLHLEKKYAPLYRDAKIRIRPVTALEDLYVDITSRGTPSAGELKGDAILSAQHTIEPVEVGRVLNVLDKGGREHLAALLNGLGRGLKDRGASFRAGFAELAPFLTATEDLMRALAERRENLARFVHNFNGMLGEMAQHDRQLASFVKSADATLGALATNDQPFSAMLAELPPTLQAMRSAFADLRTTEDRLDPALRALQPVAQSLPAGLDALDKFSRDAQPALVALRPSVRSLRPLATTLRPTASSLSSAFAQLREQAPKLDSATKKAEPAKCLEYTTQFLNRLMSITKFSQGDPKQPGMTHAPQVANARANVRFDFNSLGSVVRNPEWVVSQPCQVESGGR